MAKDVQMSIKLEPKLREDFTAAAQAVDRPAAQILRELMKAFIARQSMPNAETVAAIEAAERGDVTSHANKDALFRSLGL